MMVAPMNINDEYHTGRTRICSLSAFSTSVGLKISGGLKMVLRHMIYDELTGKINPGIG